MKISKKLILAFLAVSIIALVVGLIGIFQLMNINSRHKDLYDNYGDSQGYIGYVNTNFQNWRIYVRDMILDKDAAKAQGYMTKIDDATDNMRTYLNEFGATCNLPEEKQNYNSLSAAIDSYKVVLDKMTELCLAGKYDDAYSVLREQASKDAADVAEKLINDTVAGNIGVGTKESASLSKSVDLTITVLILIVAIAVLGSVALGVFISRSISRAINAVVRAADQLACGDTDIQLNIRNRDETAQLAKSVQNTATALQRLISDANLLSQSAIEGKLSVRADVSEHRGDYRRIIDGFNKTLDAVIMPINEASGVLNEMSNGNFNILVTGEYQGDHAAIKNAMNNTINSLNHLIAEINSAAEQVAAGTTQVAAGSQALSQGAAEQASAIEELTAAMNEIALQTKQNALNAGQANELSMTVREFAMDGNNQMKVMQQAMTQINESSESISKIIKVIDEIAFQTNLLALNAAVEAARAGQHGRGFAVVAEEVRNLALRSASAARETTKMIEESIRKVKAGTSMADNTALALEKIVGSVGKATELIGSIAVASNDQATSVAQVNSGIEQVSQVVQTNSSTAEESAAVSEELSGQASLLQDMVGRFNLNGQSGSGAKKGIADAKAAKPLPEPKRQPAKPVIAMHDKEFGKY